MNLEDSVQINDGLTQTSADGGCLWFDKKYGIMFCVYMPGKQGSYGESRSKISLSYFPASQPTNIRFIDIAEGNDEYVPNILGIGDGKVRVFYEKDSRKDCDHTWCYKDFDFLANTLSEEKTVMVKIEDGTEVPYALSVVFSYLEERGYHQHIYKCSEQMGCCTPFRAEDGFVYGGAVSFLSEVVLFRSRDNMQTVEFFAVFPHPAQYEFEYRFLNGNIYALYRTDAEKDSIFCSESADMGKTWSEPVAIKESITCRPRMLTYGGHILIAYNYYNADTGHRPEIQQGRTAVRIRIGENKDPNERRLLADLHSPYGIVNICLCEVLGDLYMDYSSSPLALEYQNGNPKVRGKDSVRFINLGNLL